MEENIKRNTEIEDLGSGQEPPSELPLPISVAVEPSANIEEPSENASNHGNTDQTVAEPTTDKVQDQCGESDIVEASNPDDEESGVNTIDPDVLNKLTCGLLSELLPNLQKSKSTLTEVTENQRILIESLQQENAKFDESVALVDVQQMMARAKLYHNKLLLIRKDMVAMHEKSAKLKKRALKLQQQKQKQILQEEQERERQLDREQQLVAKLATSKR